MGVCIQMFKLEMGWSWCVCMRVCVFLVVVGVGLHLERYCVEKKREGGNSFVAGEHRRQIEEVLC